MKNTKTKIIVSAIIFLSVAGFIGTVNAAGASLYVSPVSSTKTVGDTLSVSIGVNASGNKVCAVEGTLVFDNLTCQSITVAGDVMAQSLPTCADPHFLIGIPNCAISDKTLLTLLVQVGSAGTASISPTAIDIIGEGVSVGSASISGNYTINAVPRPMPAPTPAPAPVPALKPAPAPAMPAETPTVAPSAEEEKVAVVQLEEQKIAETPSLLAAIGSIVTFGTGNVWVGILAGFIIFAIVVYAIYGLIQRKRKNSGKIKQDEKH